MVKLDREKRSKNAISCFVTPYGVFQWERRKRFGEIWGRLDIGLLGSKPTNRNVINRLIVSHGHFVPLLLLLLLLLLR